MRELRYAFWNSLCTLLAFLLIWLIASRHITFSDKSSSDSIQTPTTEKTANNLESEKPIDFSREVFLFLLGGASVGGTLTVFRWNRASTFNALPPKLKRIFDRIGALELVLANPPPDSDNMTIISWRSELKVLRPAADDMSKELSRMARMDERGLGLVIALLSHLIGQKAKKDKEE